MTARFRLSRYWRLTRLTFAMMGAVLADNRKRFDAIADEVDIIHFQLGHG